MLPSPGSQDLKDVLCAYQIDYTDDKDVHEKDLARISTLALHARNIRMTNSCMDYMLLAEGKLGAVATACANIWDIIAAPYLVITESGGLVTDLSGNNVNFALSERSYNRTMSVLAASGPLHKNLIQLLGNL